MRTSEYEVFKVLCTCIKCHYPRYNICNTCYKYFYYISEPESANFSLCEDGAVRLVGGSNPLEGRVELCINNAWGTVCDDQFSEDDAEVICSQIGRRHNGTEVSFFGPGTGPIFLDRVNCLNSESQLLECDRNRPLGVHRCNHSQDAGVVCIGRFIERVTSEQS